MGPFLQAFEAYLAKCGARFLCRDLQTDVRQGNAGHLIVIIEFQSLAAAKAAYEAPEYQEILLPRQPHSDVSLSILEKAIMPVADLDGVWEARLPVSSVATATGERT